jgi:SAM-dependent methyltransferase
MRRAPIGLATGLIDVEQPIVREILNGLPVGVALDAACGTGRHTQYLASLGHRVVAVDSSPDMLAVARMRVPDAEFLDGDLHWDLHEWCPDGPRRVHRHAGRDRLAFPMGRGSIAGRRPTRHGAHRLSTRGPSHADTSLPLVWFNNSEPGT